MKLLLVFILLGLSLGKEVYVSVNSNFPLSICGNSTQPCAGISSGLAKCSSGDQLILTPGTYTGENNTNINIINFGSITIQGSTGSPQDVIINLNGLGYAIKFENTSASISYITIINGLNTFFGGALWIMENSTISILNTKIEGSRAEIRGGAIAAFDSILEIFNSSLLENESPEGGALYAKDCEVVTAFVVFGNNTANPIGGAISLDSSTLISRNCTFGLNYAKFQGGSIYSKPGSTSQISDANFEDSQVQGNGGAIYNSDAMISCERCWFDNCKATGGGGAIATTGYGGVNLTNSIIVGCWTNVKGGGLSVEQGSSATVAYSRLSHNSASTGGAIYEGDSSHVYIFNSDLQQNFGTNGGAIFLESNSDLRLSGANIQQNIAQEDGGGIYCMGGAVLITDSDIIQNNNAKHTYSNPDILCNGCEMTGAQQWVTECQQVAPQPAPPGFPVLGIIGIAAAVAAVIIAILSSVYVYMWKKREARWKEKNMEIKDFKKDDEPLIISSINSSVKKIDEVDKIQTASQKVPTEKNALLTDYD